MSYILLGKRDVRECSRHRNWHHIFQEMKEATETRAREQEGDVVQFRKGDGGHVQSGCHAKEEGGKARDIMELALMAFVTVLMCEVKKD